MSAHSAITRQEIDQYELQPPTPSIPRTMSESEEIQDQERSPLNPENTGGAVEVPHPFRGLKVSFLGQGYFSNSLNRTKEVTSKTRLLFLSLWVDQ